MLRATGVTTGVPLQHNRTKRLRKRAVLRASTLVIFVTRSARHVTTHVNTWRSAQCAWSVRAQCTVCASHSHTHTYADMRCGPTMVMYIYLACGGTMVLGSRYYFTGYATPRDLHDRVQYDDRCRCRCIHSFTSSLKAWPLSVSLMSHGISCSVPPSTREVAAPDRAQYSRARS